MPASHGTLDRGDSRTLGTFLHGGFIDREQALKHETKSHLERLLSEPLAGEKIKLVDRYELKWNTYADRTLRAERQTLERLQVAHGGRLTSTSPPSSSRRIPATSSRATASTSTSRPPTPTSTPAPKRPSNVDPVRLLVVSSGDLLVEIGKEEEVLGAKLDEALAKLRLCRDNYAFVNSKHLIRLPDEIGAVTVKSKTVIQDVAKAKETRPPGRPGLPQDREGDGHQQPRRAARSPSMAGSPTASSAPSARRRWS